MNGTSRPLIEPPVRESTVGKGPKLQSADAAAKSELRTFLIADVRGYTRFTQEYGDEMGAQLATLFASVARDGVFTRGGEVIELRGDEALARV